MVKPLWAEAAATLSGPKSDGWTEVIHLVPANDDVVPQYAVQLPDGWALTQGRDNGTGSNATDDLILTKFDKDGKRLETRIVPRGGHGDRAYCIDGKLVVQVKGIWARVTFGSPWSWRGTDTPTRCALRGGDNLQGEARLPSGQWLRLYGGSIKTDPAWHRGENAYLQVIEGTTVVRRISLDKVARDSDGHPIGGRYEPEGVSVGTVEGIPCVLVGFAVGQLGHTTMRVYAKPIEAL